MPPPPLSPTAPPALWLGPVERPEVSLGAFQRAASAVGPLPAGTTLTRRLSGGPALWLAPGTVHLLLALPSPSALAPDADPHRLLNRYVRPLLRGIHRLGPRAHYFGRDWVTVSHRPVAWVGFAHHARSGACAFEAFVALRQPFALPPSLDAYPPRAAPAFLGKVPASLDEVAGREIALDQALDRLGAAYDRAWSAPLPRARWGPALLRPAAHDPRPPWEALVEEVIGFVGASRSPSPELGGDFLASCDLIEAINERLAAAPPAPSPDDLRRLLTEAVEQTGGALEGIRDASSLLRALAALGGTTPGEWPGGRASG